MEQTGIGLIDVTKLTFIKSKHGFLGMTYDGVTYPRVVPMRILPFHAPEQYLSLTAEGKEVGILADMAELSPEQAALLREALEQRYFCPKIRSIESMKEKMGYVYMETTLAGGKTLFAVKDASRDIRLLDDRRVLIFDVDGNRYCIDDIGALEPKGRKLLETYLF